MLLTGLAAAIPVINSTVKAVRAGWMPAGDDGIIATRGWDVLTSHSAALGQYSEEGRVRGEHVPAARRDDAVVAGVASIPPARL